MKRRYWVYKNNRLLGAVNLDDDGYRRMTELWEGYKLVPVSGESAPAA